MLTAGTRVRSVRCVLASQRWTSIMSIFGPEARAVSIKLVRKKGKKRKKNWKKISVVLTLFSPSIFHRILGLAERLHQLELRFSRKKSRREKKSTNGCGTKIRIDGGVCDAKFSRFLSKRGAKRKKMLEKIALVLAPFHTRNVLSYSESESYAGFLLSVCVT